MLEWAESHEVLLGWLGAASAVMFVGSLAAVPWLVIRMPDDYFVCRRRFVDRWLPRRRGLRAALLILKNLGGIVLVLAGLAMLVLPGQGILTILVGLMCLDVPGKFALEQKLARLPAIIGAMNWIRARAGRRPLLPPAEARNVRDAN